MAFKIDKKEQARIADLAHKLTDERVALEEAINEENARREDALADLNQRFEKFNELLEEARGYVEDIWAERQGEFDDKSENWQEGERGETTREWLSNLEGKKDDELATGFDPLEEEPLDFSEVPDHAEVLTNLELEPNY